MSDEQDEIGFLEQFLGEEGGPARYTLLLFVVSTALGLVEWLLVPASSLSHYIYQAVAGVLAGVSFSRLLRRDPL